MNRTQKFNPALGVQGNIEEALWQNQYRRTEILNEQDSRLNADIENREAVEQEHTDSYLDLVEAQQMITELQLEIEELKRGVSK